MSISVKMWIYQFYLCLAFINGEQFTGPLAYYASFPNKMIRAEKSFLTVPKRITAEKCASECILRASGSWDSSMTSLPCFAFEYIHSIGICILLKVAAGVHVKQGYDALKPASGTTYYELAKPPLSLFLVVKNHTLYDKNDYSRIVNNVSLDTCVYLCYTSPRMSCNSFAYNNDLKLCAISHVGFDETHRLLPARGFDHHQYTGNWPCNVTLPWRYGPRVIASKGYPHVTHSAWSCDFKLIAPIGQQVLLNVTSFYSNRTYCDNRQKTGVTVYDGLTDNATVLSHLCRQSDCVHPTSLKSSSGTLLIRIKQEMDEIVTRVVYGYEISDNCDGHQCRNGATCVVDTVSYQCACVEGFSGQLCEENVDDCKRNPCLFNGRCVDGINTYTCECLHGSTGKHCEQYIGACYTEPCKHGNCTPTFSGFKCTCLAGYTGTYCEYDVNECYSSPCDHGKCIDLLNGFRCECDTGFTGLNCNMDRSVATCYPANCQFGTCAMNESGSFCQCFPGFTGSKCEVNIDDCVSAPCHHGSCLDHVNAYTCKCSQGYVGKHCDIFTSDPCRGNPCDHGYCSIVKAGFKCICNNGYYGSKCERKLQSCDTRPCANGQCRNVGSSYSCQCFSGFTGANCSTEVDVCKNTVCVHGTCVNHSAIKNVPFCKCMPGYAGDKCDVPFDHCNGINCNNGQCLSIIGGYKCECKPTYTGSHCDTILDTCSTSLCSGQGTCIVKRDKHICKCDDGFEGDRCEITLIVCEQNHCINGGTCIRHGGGRGSIYSCTCMGYYTGHRCEKLITTTPGTPSSKQRQHIGPSNSSVLPEFRTINYIYRSSTKVSIRGTSTVVSSPPTSPTLPTSGEAYTLPPSMAAPTFPGQAPISQSATVSTSSGVGYTSPATLAASAIPGKASLASPTTMSTLSGVAHSSSPTLTASTFPDKVSLPYSATISTLSGIAHSSSTTLTASTVPRKKSLSSPGTTSTSSGIEYTSLPTLAASIVPGKAPLSSPTTTLSGVALSSSTKLASLPREVFSSPATLLASTLPDVPWKPYQHLIKTVGHGFDSNNAPSSTQPLPHLKSESLPTTASKLPKYTKPSSTTFRFSFNSPTYFTRTAYQNNSDLYHMNTTRPFFTQTNLLPLSPTNVSITPRKVTQKFQNEPQTKKSSFMMTSTESSINPRNSHTLFTTQAFTRSNTYTPIPHIKLISNESSLLLQSLPTSTFPMSTAVVTETFVTRTTIGCFGCGTQRACNNKTCIHGTCNGGIDGVICVCQEGYSERDCSVAIIDRSDDDVITAESAIIGALGAALLAVIAVAVFIFYQRRKRGSIYINPPCLPRQDDTAIKKRYSARDVHSELMAQRYSNPTFVSTDETVRKTHCRREQGYFPPSPKSSSSENSQSTSSSRSRGQWYEPVQPCNNTTPSILQSPSLWEPRDIALMRKTLYATDVRKFTDDGNYSVPKPTKHASTTSESKPSALTGSNIQRSYKSENIPEAVRTACERPFLVTDTPNMSTDNPFFRLHDGGIAMRLASQNQRSLDDYQTLLEEILEHSDYMTFDSDGKRETVQHISGTENGKSEA